MVASLREPRVPGAWPGTHVPNFSDWRGGDIVLVHRTPDAIGYAIQASQTVSAFARQHIGEPYSVIQAVISKVFPGSVPVPDAMYCSTLVGLVVADATGIDLSSDPAHQPLHPGTLAAHPELTDVLLEWRNL